MRESAQANQRNTIQYSHSNRRSNSVLEQISQTSRQNLQLIPPSKYQISSNYQSQYQLNDPYSGTKENYSTSQHFATSKRNSTSQVNTLQTQNNALKLELQTQKQKYQQEINFLKRNITLKDQLLDQCQSEINNLKNTYKTLISQFTGINASQNEVVPQITTARQHESKQGFLKERSKNGQNLIPLSIITKGLCRSGSNSKGVGQKLTHGLMKGRI